MRTAPLALDDEKVMQEEDVVTIEYSSYDTDYLFGTPFYYQETWWFFQSISSEISVWDLIDCKDPCSYSYYTFATRVAIDDNEELDLFMQGFYN